MNNKEREKFWKTLCSLKGVNIPEDEKILSETIIYPSKIYRYRPVSKRTLDALKNNELFFQLQIIMMIHLIHLLMSELKISV